MDEFLKKDVRSIEESSAKLAIDLYQLSWGEIILFAIVGYSILLLTILLLNGPNSPPGWIYALTFGVLGGGITLPIIRMISIHYKYITLRFDAEDQTFTAAGKRSYPHGRGQVLFIGTVPLHDVQLFECIPRTVHPYNRPPITYHYLVLHRHAGESEDLYSGSKVVVEYLADRINMWLKSAR